MEIINIINFGIQEFKKKLKTDFFNKNEIEEFLKTYPNIGDDYIDAIAEYISKKYKNEITLYIELGKNYLNRNIDVSIKYFNFYMMKGGDNKEVLFLLAKLYKQKGSIIRYLNIIKHIKLDKKIPIPLIEELSCMYLFDKRISFSKNILKKLIRILNKKKIKEKKYILKNILNKIIDVKILDKNLFNITGSKRWIDIINANYKKLEGENLSEEIRYKLGKYYFNEYIISGDRKFGDKFVKFIDNPLVLKTMVLYIVNNKIFNENKINKPDSKRWIDFIEQNSVFMRDIRFYDIFKQLKEYHKNKNDLIGIIKNVCEMITIDGNRGITDELGFILKGNNFNKKDKKNIVKILKYFYSINRTIKIKNIFLNEIEILENKINLKSKPRELEVTLTTKCNLRCIMCDIHSLPEYTINNKIYNYIKKTLPYLENIVWKGGEVFLYDKFYEIVNFASKYSVRQTIITNGLFLTEDYVKLIAKYNIELVISIDAADKTTYELIRIGANFDRLLDNLKMLKQYCSQNKLFKYKMTSVIMSINSNQIKDLIAFAILHEFESLYFQSCTECENSYLLLQDVNKENVALEIEKYRQDYQNTIPILADPSLSVNYLKRIFDLDLKQDQKNTVNSKSVPNKEKKKNETFKKFCYNPFFKMALNPERNNINFGCGCTDIDISKYKLDEIWNCQQLIKYRKSILNGDKSVCALHD